MFANNLDNFVISIVIRVKIRVYHLHTGWVRGSLSAVPLALRLTPVILTLLRGILACLSSCGTFSATLECGKRMPTYPC